MRTTESKKEILKQFLLVWGILQAIGAIGQSVDLLNSNNYEEYMRILTTTPFLARMAMVMFLAAAAAAGHYYWLYKRYFAEKQYRLYSALLLAGIAGMIILDGAFSAIIEFGSKVTVSDLIWVRQTLQEFEKSLPPYFLKIHKSYIINTRMVDRIAPAQVTIGFTTIPVSPAFKKELFSHMGLKNYPSAENA